MRIYKTSPPMVGRITPCIFFNREESNEWEKEGISRKLRSEAVTLAANKLKKPQAVVLYDFKGGQLHLIPSYEVEQQQAINSIMANKAVS